MIISIISLILALALAAYSQVYMLQIELMPLAALMAFVGTAFCIMQPLLQILILTPLQKTEQNLLPYAIENYHNDKPLNLVGLLLYLFAFISYVFAIALIALNLSNPIWLFAGWIFALGVAVDLLRDQISRMISLINPFRGVEKLQEKAKKAIQNNEQVTLLEAIDGLSEVSIHSIEKGKLSLGMVALDSFPAIMQAFFSSAKSIGHGLASNGKDRIGYTVFYLLQRLNLIFELSLRHGFEMICQHIITVLGKLINYAGHCDLSLVTYPAHVLGTFVQKAQLANMNAVAMTANSTLVEVSRNIVSEVDLTYSELIEPFQAIIMTLDNIAKQRFKKDKSINIRSLQQPLLQMKEIFKTGKIATHRDTPTITRDIDQVIAEFAALEQVMLNAPPPLRT